MVGDKTSMANSIEARVPFLDYGLVEIDRIPATEPETARLQGKYLHKKAMEKWLPKDVVYRKKKGFANPVDQWLRSTMRRYIGDCLLSETSAVNKYFDRKYIEQIVAEHEANNSSTCGSTDLLISFELWHQQFIHTPATTSSAIHAGSAT